jgi:hypothetical protein
MEKPGLVPGFSRLADHSSWPFSAILAADFYPM